jgi:cleavage and polyadenylation specificity factor subunit 3
MTWYEPLTDGLQIMGIVDVKHVQEHEVVLEWSSGASNDMIADSTLALLTSADCSPASVKRAFLSLLASGRSDCLSVTTHSHKHHHVHADLEHDTNGMHRIERLAMFLEQHFNDSESGVEFHMPDPSMAEDEPTEEQGPAFIISLDGATARIDVQAMASLNFPSFGRELILLFQTVSSLDEALRKRVETVLDMASVTITSLSDIYLQQPRIGEEDIAFQKLQVLNGSTTDADGAIGDALA